MKRKTLVKESIDFRSDRELIGWDHAAAGSFDHFDKVVTKVIDHLKHWLGFSAGIIRLKVLYNGILKESTRTFSYGPNSGPNSISKFGIRNSGSKIQDRNSGLNFQIQGRVRFRTKLNCNGPVWVLTGRYNGPKGQSRVSPDNNKIPLSLNLETSFSMLTSCLDKVFRSWGSVSRMWFVNCWLSICCKWGVPILSAMWRYELWDRKNFLSAKTRFS